MTILSSFIFFSPLVSDLVDVDIDMHPYCNNFDFDDTDQLPAPGLVQMPPFPVVNSIPSSSVTLSNAVSTPQFLATKPQPSAIGPFNPAPSSYSFAIEGTYIIF